jgi:hypothetical protein
LLFFSLSNAGMNIPEKRLACLAGFLAFSEMAPAKIGWISAKLEQISANSAGTPQT